MIIKDTIRVYPLGDERRIQIYIPDELDEGQRCPVLYIMDGQNAFYDEEAYSGVSWGFADYAYSNNLKIIMVALDCAPGFFKRESEYGPWDISKQLSYHETRRKGYIIKGKGQEFARWLVEDLKPLIDREFPTDPNHTSIVGSSMGGVISSYVALAYPEVFSRSASLSTAYWFYEKEFCDLIKEQDLSAVKCFYFDIGSDEGCGEYRANIWYRISNALILSRLQRKIDNLHFRYVGGASHNEAAWRARVDYFMTLFYGDYGE